MTQPTRIIIGIDPGGRSTGIVARRRNAVRNDEALIAALVVERDPANPIDDHGPGLARWVDAVLAAIAEVTTLSAVAASDIDPAELGAKLGGAPWLARRMADGTIPDNVELAVETFRRPSPHARRRDGNSLTNVDGLLATAAIVGAILARWPATILVEPAGHGSHTRGAYPSAIDVPAGGRGADRNRHARSAYDVAAAALFAGSAEAALLAAARSTAGQPAGPRYTWAHRPTPPA